MAGRRNSGDGLSLQTLVIASMASATAALVVSQFWKGGTVMSAAITPVVVAIVSEMLHRPAQTVTRFTATSRPEPAVRETVAVGSGQRVGEPSTAGLERLGGEVASISRGAPPPPDGPREGGMRVYAPPKRRGLHWKVIVATGLLGFVIAASVLTLPELIGGSAIGGDRKTTIFGGSAKKTESQPTDEREQTTTEQTTTEEQTTPEQTETNPQQPTTTEQTPPAQQPPAGTPQDGQTPTTPTSPAPAPPQSTPSP